MGDDFGLNRALSVLRASAMPAMADPTTVVDNTRSNTSSAASADPTPIEQQADAPCLPASAQNPDNPPKSQNSTKVESQVRSPVSLENEQRALEALVVVLGSQLEPLMENLSRLEKQAAQPPSDIQVRVHECVCSTVTRVSQHVRAHACAYTRALYSQEQNVRNARMVIEGEVRVFRHFKSMAETAIMYARVLRERLASATGAAGAITTTPLDLDTKLPQPPQNHVAGKKPERHHQQTAIYCKKVILRLFKRVMAGVIRGK